MAIYFFKKECVVRIVNLMAKPVESWIVSKMIEHFLEAQWVPLGAPGMSKLFPGQALPNCVGTHPQCLCSNTSGNVFAVLHLIICSYVC